MLNIIRQYLKRGIKANTKLCANIAAQLNVKTGIKVQSGLFSRCNYPDSSESKAPEIANYF